MTVRDLRNDIVKKSALPIRTVAGEEKLLCKSEDGVVLLDHKEAGARANHVVLGELRTRFVKHLVWSDDIEGVALLSKRRIIISSKTLDLKCEVVEDTELVKSGAWYNNVDGNFPESMKQ
ncbi:unnamed protein product [Arabis nemorensis]|uniref:Uncharacterized protein n=1 Tax=Arabis nemorensis TaxID=586526 RepID=A0A565C914_9BRAS|nr:unnamed protein product [Arabis nemorensis]